MGITWTKDQQKVINAKNGNILVAAAAGSGKTAVLVERIIQTITDQKNDVNIDELLIVTFTKAAASEMRTRISQTLSKMLEENPNDKHLYKQLMLMNHANITTIHSFCLEVIKMNFHLIDLDPSFRIVDETENDMLKSEVLKNLLEEWYSKEDDKFYNLVESYGGNLYDNQLENYILNIYEFIQSCPWPEEWLNDKVQVFKDINLDNFESCRWVKGISQYIKVVLVGLEKLTQKAKRICIQPTGPIKYEAAIDDDLLIIKQLINAADEDFNHFYNTIKNIKFSSLKRTSKDTDENLKEQVKQIRNDVKKAINSIKSDIFYKPKEQMIEDIHNIYPILKILSEIVIGFSHEYSNTKKERGIIDFSDIEHMTLKILLDNKSSSTNIVPSEAAIEFQNKFKEILIDEYQDSNLVQETIMNCISRQHQGTPNIFMVGDVKQSIYRFRLAKPELFLEKYNTYSSNDNESYRRIDLSKNFRSRDTIINGSNYIFDRLMNPYVGEINYDDKAALYYGANYKELKDGRCGGPIEVNIFDKSLQLELDEVDENLNELSKMEYEAKIVVDKINNLVNDKDFKVYDKDIDDYRTIKYSDIVILLRATSNWASVFIEEFIKNNVPVYADLSEGYFDSIEIKTVLSLLQILDNPKQDIPLISVLYSRIVGLTVNELMTIRTTCKDSCFYDALIEYVETDILGTALSQKVKSFIEQLTKWREKAMYTPLNELIWDLYTTTGYYNYVGMLKGGAQRQANLNALIEKAVKYETTSYKGLFNFVRFIKQIQLNRGDIGITKITGDNSNLVKIMSIHKSKGLEFPVVILSGMGKQFNEFDLKSRLLLHQDLGIGTDYVDFNNRVIYRTLSKTSLSNKIRLENLSEEMRILYVALTRAREKLILTGCVNDLEKNIDKWTTYLEDETEKLSPYVAMHSRTYFDWVMPIILRCNDETLFKVRQINIKDITDLENSSESDIEQVDLMNWNSDENYSNKVDLINANLNWKYSKMNISSLPIKVTVSDIKRESQKEEYYESASINFQNKNEEYAKPKFLEDSKKYTSAEKGTIYHKIFRYIDLNNINSEIEVHEQFEKLLYKKLLSEEEVKVINKSKFIYYGQSSLVQRMKNADALYREVPFVLGVPIKDIYKDIVDENNEISMVQGVIDCYFEEDNEIVVVDYKTDYVEKNSLSIDNIKKRYKSQLELYATALEKITKKRVKEKVLYLVNINQTILI